MAPVQPPFQPAIAVFQAMLRGRYIRPVQAIRISRITGGVRRMAPLVPAAAQAMQLIRPSTTTPLLPLLAPSPKFNLRRDAANGVPSMIRRRSVALLFRR